MADTTSPVGEPTKAAGPGRRGFGAGFWKLWTASTLSNLGDGVSLIAYPWLAATLTRDPALIAGVALFLRLPWLLVSLPAGALVDRSDRRRLMAAMDGLRFALTGLVALTVLTGTMTLPLLYVIVLLLGCAEVVFDNASQTILPSVVPPERLERANGTLWGAQIVANEFVGPPLGGLLLGLALAAPFVLDAGSFAVSAVLVFLIAGSFRPRGAQAAAAARRSLRREIVEGVRWLWGHRLLRTLCLLLGGMNAMFIAAFATEVLFVQEVLGLDARGFGLLSAAAAVGGLAGTQLGPNLSRRIGPGASLYLTLGGGGLVLAAVGLTSNPVLVAAFFAASGFLSVLWNIITVSLRQEIIPDRLLGRVNSVYRFFGWGMIPLGAALGGALVTVMSDLVGRQLALRTPFLVAGAAHVLMLLAAGARLSSANIAAAKAAAAAGRDPAG